MTDRQRQYGATTECLHCGIEFVPRRASHVFHNAACRHLGPREPHERELTDHAQIARLFDASRDPASRVRVDDWHPSTDPRWHELDAWDTLGERRRWHEELALLGKL